MDEQSINPYEMLNVLSVDEFLNLTLPQRKILLNPWLREASLTMIHAYRGAGKTHLALNISHALSTGKKFLHWDAPEAHGVLYVDGEMPAITLQERLKSIISINDRIIIPNNLRIITPDLQSNGIPDLSTIEGQESITKYLRENKIIKLLVLDNISCLAPTIKENDAHAWAPLNTWLLSLRRMGIAVLLIHHSGKSGKQRGSSKKEDSLDIVIFLENPEDYESSQGARFIVKYEKHRNFYGNDAMPFECQLMESSGNYHWVSKPHDSSNYQQVVKLYNEGMQQKDIVEYLTIDKGTVSKYVHRGKKEGKIKCE